MNGSVLRFSLDVVVKAAKETLYFQKIVYGIAASTRVDCVAFVEAAEVGENEEQG